MLQFYFRVTALRKLREQGHLSKEDLTRTLLVLMEEKQF